jgi:hypothetical protein
MGSLWFKASLGQKVSEAGTQVIGQAKGPEFKPNTTTHTQPKKVHKYVL